MAAIDVVKQQAILHCARTCNQAGFIFGNYDIFSHQI